MWRLQHHPETKSYAAKRTADGKTPREIKRCLKRAVARQQLFRQLEAHDQADKTGSLGAASCIYRRSGHRQPAARLTREDSKRSIQDRRQHPHQSTGGKRSSFTRHYADRSR